ncbi:MAG: D-alanyl-D-alanine carboxypeptidase family protein [Chthoniobacterales bacterium]
MKFTRWLTVLLIAFAFGVPATLNAEPQVRKATAVKHSSSSDDSDADDSTDESATPKKKSKRAARKRAPRSDEDEDQAEKPAPAAPLPMPGTAPRIPPNTRAVSVMVVDAQSGQIFYEKNADMPRAAASTQKLLTALVVAETGYLDKPVTVMPEDTMAEPVKLNIRPGETYQRIDLLRALLVKSPNDVARCLARDNAGSIEAFAEKMNTKAQQLGATHSHFVNPNGLPIPDQWSSARDLAIIARAAYANPTIRSITCLQRLVFRYANGRTRELENTNKVLRRLPYCNGMKTGYTEAAGHCLIASGTRPGRDVIVVVLGESKGNVWQDASALLTWGLSI